MSSNPLIYSYKFLEIFDRSFVYSIQSRNTVSFMNSLFKFSQYIPLFTFFSFLFLALFSFDIHSYEQDCIQGLDELKKCLKLELKKINYPGTKWLNHKEDDSILDVAIIGAGMSGATVAVALKKEGIQNIRLFDENPQGSEGPWAKTARMKILRSSKNFAGPAYGIPGLTFRSWYEAQFGSKKWQELNSVPTELWNKYLIWYRNAMELPVENEMTLVDITPHGNLLKLTFLKNDQQTDILTRKVILSTGREGCSCPEYPDYLNNISKRFYAHTREHIPKDVFKNKRIAIIGAASSSFDAAATALENGALNATIIGRSTKKQNLNKFALLHGNGILHGFYFLPEKVRLDLFVHLFQYGVPPPKESFERINKNKNLKILLNTQIKEIEEEGDSLTIHTNQGVVNADYIIVATGFCVNLWGCEEFHSFYDEIMLWQDRFAIEEFKTHPQLGNFPFLGPHLELVEKTKGNAPFLKNIYLFNYGALLSHGLLCDAIPAISFGASKVVEGIVLDFFLSDSESYLQSIYDFDKCTFDYNDSKD